MEKNIRINTYADLDINRQNDIIICNVQPGNNRTRVLTFNITNLGMNLIFPSNTFVQITWVKPDNTVIIEDSKARNSNISMEKAINTSNVASTTVTYLLSANAIAVPGICKFKIDFLLNTDDGKGGETIESLSTVSGKVRVDKEIVNNKTIISTDEYKSAAEIVEEGRKTIDEANESIDVCNKATKDCNTATNNCNKATSDCMTATNNCNAAIQTLRNSEVVKIRNKYCGRIFSLSGEYGRSCNADAIMEGSGYNVNPSENLLEFPLYGDSLSYPYLFIDTYININVSGSRTLNITDFNAVTLVLTGTNTDFRMKTVICSLQGFEQILTERGKLTLSDLYHGKIYMYQGNYYLAEKNYTIPTHAKFHTDKNTFNFVLPDSNITSFEMSPKEYLLIDFIGDEEINFDTSQNAIINIYHTYEKKILKTITATPQSFNQSIITNAEDFEGVRIYEINDNYVIEDSSANPPVFLETNYAEEIENVTFKFPKGEVNQNIKKDNTIDFTSVVPNIPTFFASTSSPTSSDGNDGDIWIQYS